MALNVHVIECNGPPTSAPDMIGQHWIDTSSGDHYLSNGTDDLDNWVLVTLDVEEKIFQVTVPASSSVDLATVPLANFCAIQYHICAKNDVEDVFAARNLHGSKVTSTTVEDSVYAVLGAPINFSTQFSVSGSDALLTVTNNEAFDLTVRFRSEII